MWLAVAVGVYSRLRGLGTWPLGFDAYYITQSVHNILQHGGVPAFGCGGYYMRGLTFQYLIAPLYELGFSDELGGRLVTVAFSLAALPAIYYLGKRLSGFPVGCVSVALLSLSLWEIEFARYIRMYIPFQTIFLWYLLTLNQVVVDRNRSSLGWMWLMSVLGVFTWAGGLFLLVTNFVPSLIKRVPFRVHDLVISSILLGLGYCYHSFDFRLISGPPPFPPDMFVHAGGIHFIKPPVLASTLLSHPVWLVGSLGLLVICLIAVAKLLGAAGPVREKLAWLVLIALSLLNLFGCVLIALMLLFLLEWLSASCFSSRKLRIAAASIAACFIFWMAYTFFTDAGEQLFWGFGPGGEISKLAVVLFKYPDVFQWILYQWYGALPTLTIVFIGLIAALTIWTIVVNRDDQHLHSIRLMLVVCLLMIAMVGVVHTRYAYTRYTFFLLPLLYALAVTAFYTIFTRPFGSRPIRGVVLGLGVLAVLVFTEDFGWAHLVHMDSARWNYRLSLDKTLTAHYRRRYDYRTTARYINRAEKPDDIVIVLHEVVATHYLKHTDYIYRNHRGQEFASISCDRGQKERWSGAPLIYSRKSLFNVINKTPDSVWLISGTHWDSKLANELKRRYSMKLVYQGLGKKRAVYKIH